MTAIEARLGRGRRTPFTDVPDWISLSGVDVEARELYRLIKMHVYVRAGDNTADPKMTDLAELMRYSRGDKISKFLRQLEDIGAIDTVRVGMPARYVFVVHEEPPDGYDGPLKLSEWYRGRRRTSVQVTPVTPGRGDQEDADKSDAEFSQVTPVAPVRGDQEKQDVSDLPEPPKRGQHVAPVWGQHSYKQEVLKQEVLPPPPPADVPTPPVDAEKPEEGEETDDLEKRLSATVDAVQKQRPGWSRSKVSAAVRAALADGRDLEVALAALPIVAADPATVSPGRLNGDGPWWAAAERTVRKPPAPVRSAICDRHVLKHPQGAECPRCTEEASNGAVCVSEGAVRASEINPEAWERLAPAQRAQVEAYLANPGGSWEWIPADRRAQVEAYLGVSVGAPR